MYRSPFPPRADSLDKAARQIMRILEREEREAMGARSPQASHSSGKEECPTCRLAANAGQTLYSSRSPIEERPFARLRGPSGAQTRSRFHHPDGVDGPRAGFTPVSAVPMPGAGPFPIMIPEVVRPGSEANQEFVDHALALYHWLRKILSPEEEGECEKERKAAWVYCREFLKNNNFRGPKSATGADFDQYFRGQLSEECGGNPVEYPENGRR